jgi:hypothetical protein
LAGNTGNVENPLLQNFILIGRKLEKLGFMYCAGKVMVVKPSSRRSQTDVDMPMGLHSEATHSRDLISRRVTG